MAIPSSAVWELNSSATAANANGGGFDPANVSMATDLTTDANTANTNSPIVSSASYNFVAGDVNNWLYIKSGTNWTPGWYQITHANDATSGSNKAMVNAAVGAAIQVNSTTGIPNPAYGANTVAGVATVGTPTSGTWTIDYSQGTAANIAAVTNLAGSSANTATPSVTSSGHTFGVNFVGNVIHITAGTNWTTGWYFIQSVSAGAAVLDRACATVASPTSGTYSLGGAIPLGSSTANQTDTLFSANIVGGNRVFWKGTGFALDGGSQYLPTAGSATTAITPIINEGYNTLRGDAPTGTNRPLISNANRIGSSGINYEHWFHLRFTAAQNGIVLSVGNNAFVYNCKVTNTQGISASFGQANAGATALAVNGSNSWIINCELVCLNGAAVQAANMIVIGCLLRGEAGVLATNNVGRVMECVIENTGGTVAVFAPGNGLGTHIHNCTIYGSETPAGVGIMSNFNNTASPSVGELTLINNIIAGFRHGIVFTYNNGSQLNSFSYNNNFYNNTTNRLNFPVGPTDTTTNPSFKNVSQVTGTGKFAGGGSTLIDTTKNFVTAGVAVGDFVSINKQIQFTGKYLGYATQENTGRDTRLSSDGTKVYVLGNQNKTIYQYTLTTAYDLSAWSYSGKSFSVNSQNTSPQGFFFKSDGTKMYMIGSTATASIYQYSLSTPWDISTASYDSVSFAVSGQGTVPVGLFIKPTGLKFYTIDGSGTRRIYQYSMSGAWDLSTASYDSVNFSINGVTTNPASLWFKDSDGTKLFYCDLATGLMRQASLSSGWDLSTASNDNKNARHPFDGGGARGITFSADGTLLFILGGSQHGVFSYACDSAWTLASATGATPGIYEITAITTTTNPNDTLTLAANPGTDTTVDKAYSITIGHNYQLAGALRATALPTTWPGVGAGTTNYKDPGAAQRPERLIPIGIGGIA